MSLAVSPKVGSGRIKCFDALLGGKKMSPFRGLEPAAGNSPVVSPREDLRISLRTAAPNNRLRRSGLPLIRLSTGAGNISMLF